MSARDAGAELVLPVNTLRIAAVSRGDDDAASTNKSDVAARLCKDGLLLGQNARKPWGGETWCCGQVQVMRSPTHHMAPTKHRAENHSVPTTAPTPPLFAMGIGKPLYGNSTPASGWRWSILIEFMCPGISTAPHRWEGETARTRSPPKFTLSMSSPLLLARRLRVLNCAHCPPGLTFLVVRRSSYGCCTRGYETSQSCFEPVLRGRVIQCWQLDIP